MLTPLHISTLFDVPGFNRNSVISIIRGTDDQPCSLSDLMDCIGSVRQNDRRIPMPDMDQLEKAYQKSSDTFDSSKAKGILTIGYGADDYPRNLYKLKDPPALIYAKGDISILNGVKNVAIIGTRKPTGYGVSCGEAIAGHFAKNGFIVTSGLALGCDTAGHRGCLEVSGRSVAVLAHGLHMTYPAKNRDLAREIIDKGGCLISEYGLGVSPDRRHFIERDRLQAGLADCVFVIETGLKGGTMHTVRSCIDLKRPLACLCHPEKYSSHEKTQGNRMLTDTKGALPVKDKDDLLGFIRSVM